MKYLLKAKKKGGWVTVQTTRRLSSIKLPKKKLRGWTYKVITKKE